MDGWIDGKIHRYIDRKIDRCTRVSRVCFMQQHHTETKTIGTSTSTWHIFQYQNAISRKTEPNHGHRKDWFLQILWSLIIWFTPLGNASRWNGGAITIPQSHTHPRQGFVMKYLAGVMSLSFHYSFFYMLSPNCTNSIHQSDRAFHVGLNIAHIKMMPEIAKC